MASVDFGLDTSWTDDMDPNGAVVTGNTLVIQALYRRLITPAQGLLYHPDYGFDVAAQIDSIVSQRDVAAILASIDRQFLFDQRVLTSKTTGVLSGVQGAFTLTTTSQVTTGLGPFSLVLAVTSVTVSIVQPQTTGA